VTTEGLGYGRREIIKQIVGQNWQSEYPEQIKFNYDQLLFVIQELLVEEAKPYFENRASLQRGFKIFKEFVRLLLYRNIANYDSMLLVSSEKGTGKSSAAIMIARYWCKLIGIKFDSDKHIAYSNADVINKIETLPKFSPLICDEAVKFASCVSGNTLIQLPCDRNKYPSGMPIKLLEGKKNFYVYSFNLDSNQIELKKAKECIKTKYDDVYEIEFRNGNKIKATAEHQFCFEDGKYLTLKEILDNKNKIWFEGGKSRQYFRSGHRHDLCGHDGYCYAKKVIYFHPTNHCSIRFDFNNKSKFISGKGGLATKNGYIESIKKLGKEWTYDIVGVEDNNNYFANDFLVHNSEDWSRRENKELKKRIAVVRDKHLLFILCFPLKIYKLDKTYLENYTNYWIDLFGRGLGAIYVKDKNPIMDSWRLKEFGKIGSYTEFTVLSKVEEKLKKHPNFWSIIRFPKPPKKVYEKYLAVREKNIYDDDNVFKTVTREDIYNALMTLTLRDVMLQDVNLSMNRIILHIKNEYDITLNKNLLQKLIEDAKQLIIKIRETNYNYGVERDTNEGQRDNI